MLTGIYLANTEYDLWDDLSASYWYRTEIKYYDLVDLSFLAII